MIDLAATQFSKGDGATYSMVVKATGYQDLTFTLETPKQSNHSSGSSGSSSGGSSSSDRSYAVSVPSAKNGDVTVSPKNASKGDRVTITVTPDKGYELDSLTVKDVSGNKLKLTDKGNGKYTFTMPGSKVTVSAEFVEEQATSIFADVPADAYYAKAVEWAVKEGHHQRQGQRPVRLQRSLHPWPDRHLPVARRRFSRTQGHGESPQRCAPRQLLL